MIIEEKKKHLIVGDDFFTVKSSINKSKLAKLYGMLSEIYRNKIGSIVREYSSNAYDANIEAYQFKTLSYEEAKKKYNWLNDERFNINSLEEFQEIQDSLTQSSEREPIVVGIDNTNMCFYVQDFGIGLSPERMRFIYFNYLDSTKESTNDEIGGFGIGAKSALSYTNTFFITTIYNKIEYQYIMTKDEMGIPQGELLSVKEDTDKPNGTLIRIPFQDVDKHSFVKEIKKQLCYMDNLIYKNIGYDDNEVHFNDSKIIVGKGWKYRFGTPPLNELHISLENITYSIDWTELGIHSINVPFALTFKIGELEPTPSRESIVYTRHSIEVLKNRIKEFQDNIIEKYNKTNYEIEDFKIYYKARRSKDFVFNLNDSVNPAFIRLDTILGSRTKELKPVTYKSFTEAGISESILPPNLFFQYNVRKKIYRNNGSWYDYNLIYDYDQNDSEEMWGDEMNIIPNKNFYIFEDVLKGSKDLRIIKKRKDTLKQLKIDLKLNLVHKSAWRSTITSFNKIISDIINERITLNYDDILINPNWTKSFKAGKSIYSTSKSKKVKIKNAIHVNRYSYTWNSYQMKLNDIENFKGMVIYEHTDERVRIPNFFNLLLKGLKRSNSSHILLITVSKTNCKILKEMDNTYTIDEAFKAKLKPLIRACTAYKLKPMLSEYSFMTSYFSKLNTEIANVIYNLRQYVNDHEYNVYNNKFSSEIITIADKLDLYDHSVLDKVKILEDYFKDVPILRVVDYSHLSHVSNGKIIINYMKKSKKRINEEYYNIKK